MLNSVGKKVIEFEEPENKDLTWLKKFATLLQNDKFYGKVVLIYQKGRITTYHKTETGKPE